MTDEPTYKSMWPEAECPDCSSKDAELTQYKRLLDEEAAASLALTAELRDIAAAAGVFRHPDEKDQVANCAEKMREALEWAISVADGVASQMTDKPTLYHDNQAAWKLLAAELRRRAKVPCAPSAPPALQVAGKSSGE